MILFPKCSIFAALRKQIIGSGTDGETSRYKTSSANLGIDDMVVWHGKIPNAEVQRIMRKSDIFLFTSIMEGTPHVVL